MLRTVKTAGIALLALLTLVPAASAQRRVVVSGRFGFGRPVPYYPYAYRAWWPGWDWGWGPYYAPQQVPATGEVKLISPLKNDRALSAPLKSLHAIGWILQKVAYILGTHCKV